MRDSRAVHLHLHVAFRVCWDRHHPPRHYQYHWQLLERKNHHVEQLRRENPLFAAAERQNQA